MPGEATVRPLAVIRQHDKAGRKQTSMAGRLRSGFPPAGVAWWTIGMGRTAVSTQRGFMPTLAGVAIRADVPQIACPTLLLTTAGSGLATVDATRAWPQMLPDAALLVLPGEAAPVAASDAGQGAQAPRAFIARRAPDA